LRVVLVGEGSERDRLERRAASLGLGERVRFAGHVDRPETMLASFDLYALSSDTEQMPLSLVEAMAAGLPVVATDVGDVRAMVPAEQGPFVVPATDDPADFARALARLADDAGLRRRLGELNREHARAGFDAGIMIERYRSLFESRLGRQLPTTRDRSLAVA
jgi:glycosyltransferase involved in cell wall biosynthesis